MEGAEAPNGDRRRMTMTESERKEALDAAILTLEETRAVKTSLRGARLMWDAFGYKEETKAAIVRAASVSTLIFNYLVIASGMEYAKFVKAVGNYVGKMCVAAAEEDDEE